MTQSVDIDARKDKGRRVGYARIAGDHSGDDMQMRTLRAAGCAPVYQEQAFDKTRDFPILRHVLSDLKPGDMLVVVRFDSVGKSLSHLLQMIDDLRDRGMDFQSIEDSMDTSAAGGHASIELLRSIDHFQRRLMTETTKAGIKVAKARGARPGNPGLRERRPEAIAAVATARHTAYLKALTASSTTWLPTVEDLRPQHDWDNVVRVLNHQGQSWTVERLRRAVHALVEAKLVKPDLLRRAPRRAPEDHPMKLVAALRIANPSLSLRDIGRQLDQMGAKPVRGGKTWQPSSIRHLLDEAHRFGLLRRAVTVAPKAQ